MKDYIIVLKKVNEEGTDIIHPAPEMFNPESKTRNLLASTSVLPLTASDEDVLDFIIKKDCSYRRLIKDKESEDEAKKRLGISDLDSLRPYRIKERANLPTDRIFRNAWVADNDHNVLIDVPKAQEIHKNRLRQLRQPLLDKLDIDYQRADEQDNRTLKNQIAAKKQALRDVTKLTLPSSLDALKVFIPDILK